MKKRSSYRPRVADPTAAARRLLRGSSAGFERDQITDLCLLHSAALADLMQGRATSQTLGVLGATARIALMLCKGGMGTTEVVHVRAAMYHLAEIEQRQAERGGYIARGEELEAIRSMIEIHQAQLESDDCEVGLVVRAIDAAKASELQEIA